MNSDPITGRAPVPSVKIDADDSVEFDVTDEDETSIRINSDGCGEEEAGVDEGDQIGAVHRRNVLKLCLSTTNVTRKMSDAHSVPTKILLYV